MATKRKRKEGATSERQLVEVNGLAGAVAGPSTGKLTTKDKGKGRARDVEENEDDKEAIRVYWERSDGQKSWAGRIGK